MCLGMANGGITINLQEALDIIKEKVDCSDTVTNAAMTLVTMAASRQISEKPIACFSENNKTTGSKQWKKGQTRYRCPHCDEYVLEYMSHCDKCGKNLDWSEK